MTVTLQPVKTPSQWLPHTLSCYNLATYRGAVMSIQTPSNRKTIVIGLLGAGGGFIMGFLGNLVAAWIQQDWLKNQFNTIGLILIIGLTVIGLILSVWWGTRQPEPSAEALGKNRLIDVENTRGSEINLKGEGAHLERVNNDDNSKIHIES
jgi:MFS family permease